MIVFLTVSVAGCGRGGSPKEKISIEFMYWEVSPEGSKFISEIVDEFEKKNPDVKIKKSPVESEYVTKLTTRFVSGVSPDIFEVWTGWLTPFIDKSQILALDPYLERSKVVRKNDFFRPSLFNFYYDRETHTPGKGSLYGLPKDFGTNIILYNKDLFDKTGLPYPDKSWTWEDYLKYAKRLTVYSPDGRLEQIGIERPLDPFAMIIQLGGDIWSEDYRRCLLDTPAAIKAYQMWYDLQEKYRVCLRQSIWNSPEAGGVLGGKGLAVGFVVGKAGMKLSARHEIPDLVKYIGNKFRLGYAPLPLVNNSRREHVSWPSGWAISTFTRHPKETWRFMEYLGSKEVNIKNAELGWNIPARKDAAYSEHFLHHPPSPQHPQGLNKLYLEQVDTLYLRTLNPYIQMTKVNEILGAELHYEKIRKEAGNVEDALRRAVKKIDAEIDSATSNFQ